MASRHRSRRRRQQKDHKTVNALLDGWMLQFAEQDDMLPTLASNFES